MLTTKNRAQIFVIFFLAVMVMGAGFGCAPAGARALRKGEKLIQEGKYSEAVKKFEEATKELPTNAKAWNHLGLGYQYAGEPKKAAQAYQQALTLDRNLAVARLNLGSLYLEQRNFLGAITELTTFVQLEPKNPDGWLKLGSAQMQYASLFSGAEKTRQLDAAKKSLDFSQKLAPSAEALNAIGLWQIQRGRFREAIPSFTAALQEQPGYAPALLNLGVLYHQYLNDRRLALENYRQYLAVAKQAPDTAQIQSIVRQLEAEINPPMAVTTPAAPTAVKPSTPVNSSPPVIVKTETNLAKPAPITRVAPTVSVPKTQPLPKKETPIEVARLPDELPPVKSAQDILPTNFNKSPDVVLTSPNAPPTPVQMTEPPQKGTGKLSKLNPVSWFKKKPKAVTPVTELPLSKPTIQEQSVVVEKPVQPAAPPKPVFPRYKYRSPAKPREGNRVEAEPFFKRGVQAQKDRHWADALEAYRQAIKSDPAYFEATYNSALVARDVGDLSASLATYEKALAIMPESINSRYNFAFTLQEAGYFQDAANELQRLLGQNPNETRAHLLLGNLAAQRLSQISLARDHYQKVLEAEPQHPQATQIRFWLASHP